MKTTLSSMRRDCWRTLWPRAVLLAGLAAAALAWQSPASAQAEAAGSAPSAAAAAPAAAAASAPLAPVPTVPGTHYSKKGADTCLDCHDADSDTATFSTAGIFKSRHAFRGDKRAPFGAGGLQCEACHGPGANHSDKRAKPKPTINSLKANSFMPPVQRNQPCLECHQDKPRNAWHVGAHDSAQLACTDCHQLHVERDAVLATKTQPDVCFRCHQQQRAEFHKPNAHPVLSGRMGCSECHNAHGSTSTAMLGKPTVNETCYSCHADKRGPFLWEHAPVSEDCSLCHTSHGSVRSGLLTKSAPLLCQQCHTAAGHPAVARTGAALPGNGSVGAIFALAGSCTNCHSQVHGSNHPAGAKLMR